MARDINLRANLTADDKLTPAAEKAGAALDDLESRDVEVPIAADTTKAERDIDGLISKIDRLGAGEAANLLLTSNALTLLDDIARLTTELDQLDATDPRVDVTIANIAQAQGDLDKLQAKAQELNGTSITLDTRSSVQGLDNITRSASSSRSVLANMVGNATQDLGALGGIAGSAGVAIGQMGEYMVDAANDGDKLGQVLGNFAKVAIPIALIAEALELASRVSGRFADSSKRTAASVDELATAMDDVDGSAAGYVDALREADEVTLDVTRSQSGLQNVLGEMNSDWKTAGLVTQLFGKWMGASKDETKDMTETLVRAKISAQEWATWVTSAVDDTAMLTARLKETNLTGDEQAAVLELLRQKQDDAAKAAYDHAIQQEFLGDASEEAADGSERLAAAQEFLGGMARVAAEAMAEMVQAERDAVVAQKAAREEAAALAEELKEAAAASMEARDAVADLGEAFAGMSIRDDAISRVFDLGNAPLDAAADLRDIEIAIEDIDEAAKDLDLSKGMDVSNVSLDPLLDAFDALRPKIQEQVANAFAGSGPEAATALAQGFVDRLYAELGGRVSKEDIERTLFGDGIEATIAVAIEQSSVEKAKRLLEIFTGIPGADPTLVARVAMALEAGTITGAEAQAIVLDAIGGEIGLPTGVEPPSDESVAAAMVKLGDAPPGMIPTAADLAGFYTGISQAVPPPSTVPTSAELSGFLSGVSQAAIPPKQVQTEYLPPPVSIEDALGIPPAVSVPTSADLAGFFSGVSQAVAPPAVVPVQGDTSALLGSVSEAKATAQMPATMPLNGDAVNLYEVISGAAADAETQRTMPIDGDPSGANSAINGARGNAERGATMPIRGTYTGTSGVPSSITIPVRLQASGTVAGVPQGIAPTSAGPGVGLLAAPTVQAASAPAPAVTLPPIIVNVAPAKPTNVTIQAGVVGNRYDVERVVARALRAHGRLNGEPR